MTDRLDRSTTPPSRRLPAALGLSLMGIWLTGAFLQAMADHTGTPLPGWVAPAVWFGHYQMFTEKRPTHARLLASRRMGDGPPEDIDLAALFPAHWHAGPGYERGGFLRDPARLEQLGRATCARLTPARGQLTLTREVWPKRPGQADQSLRPDEPGLREDILLTLQCEDSP